MQFGTRSGTLRFYAAHSAGKEYLLVGAEGPLGSGFFSIPLGKRELLRGAGTLAAALLLYDVRRRKRKAARGSHSITADRRL